MIETRYSRQEIVEIVKMVRLDLYNQGLHCGAGAIRKEMEADGIEPMPSESTIGRILALNGLTYGRTGFCEGE